MQHALINGRRTEASSGAKATCPTCGSDMVAKCGPRIVHHWAHTGRPDCDPWWENETPWHREWKNLFPPGCREICHAAPDGEVQGQISRHRNRSPAFRHHRRGTALAEAFYGNLIWIIDGKPFKANFDIYHQLPHPRSNLAQDIVWTKARRHMNGSNRGLFFRVSECRKDDPDVTKATLRGSERAPFAPPRLFMWVTRVFDQASACSRDDRARSCSWRAVPLGCGR
jgi:competence protein CoiA